MRSEQFNDLTKSMKQAIEHAHTTTLSEEDFERFLDALEEDEPNDNLKKAVQRHNEFIDS